MNARFIGAAAALACILAFTPGKDADPDYRAGCTDDGQAFDVQPDTRANRAAAAEHCAELIVFQRVGAIWGN